jgi:5'-AMP-activated protein kinase catalytic alpha subunit
MEYADGGSLLDYVRARKKLSEKEAARFFHQLCRALEHCHQHGIVHRDVKLENVLLDAGENVKLIDFGLSAVLAGDGKKLKVHCGSPSYAAPEIVARRAYDGPAGGRVVRRGSCCSRWCAGTCPSTRTGGNKQELCAKIQRGVFTIPDAASEDFKALIKTVLRVDPSAPRDA